MEKSFNLGILFIVILIGFLGNVSANPVIDNWQGNVSDGENITLFGGGFGVKENVTPRVWDDCSGENFLEIWNGGWPTQTDQPASSPRYAESGSIGGVLTAHNHTNKYLVARAYDEGSGAGFPHDNMIWHRFGSAPNYVYASWYQRVHPNYDSGDNFKWFDYSGGTSPYDNSGNWYLEYVGGIGNSHHINDNGAGLFQDSNKCDGWYGRDYLCNSWYFGSSINPKSQWIKIEVIIYVTDQNDGWIDLYEEGVHKLNTAEIGTGTHSYNGPTDKTISDSSRNIGIGGYNRNDGINNWRFFNDLYIDDTLSRVILGDQSNLSSSTKREIQIPQTWSDNEVKINFNQGTFQEGEQAYLFVVDSENNPSEGYPVTIGESSGSDVSDYPQCQEGKITEICNCGGKDYWAGYCCNDVWFDSTYQESGGCPQGDFYYVSPNGTESWPDCKSKDNPCEASNQTRDFLNAEAGEVVVFLDGVYYTGTQSIHYRYPTWNPVNSGMRGAEIIFKAQNAGQVILNGNVKDGISVNIIGGKERSYIVWDGFKLTANGGEYLAKVRFDGTDSTTSYCTIKNCEIVGASHNTGGAINHEGIRLENAEHITIENCYVHGFIETSDNWNTGGFKSYGTSHVVIKNCEFTNNTDGIYIKGYTNDNYTIENTWIHDNNYNGLRYVSKSESTDELTVKNCVFSNESFLNMCPSTNYDANSTTNNMVMHDNTIIKGENAISWLIESDGDGPVLYNNIIYGIEGHSLIGLHNENDEVRLGDIYSLNPKECDHNRLSFSGEGIIIGLYADNTRTYNSLSSWQSSGELSDGSNPGEGSITADPKFMNYSGTMSELRDFELAEDSPCRQAGRGGTDMGADVSKVGTIPVSYYIVNDSFGDVCGDGVCSGLENCNNCPEDCGECNNEYHPADTNPQDGVVSFTEIEAYMNRWLNGEITLNQLLDGVNEWRGFS